MLNDHVPHNVLLLKLYKPGIDINTFKIILSVLENAYSSVKSQGLTSNLFPI